MMLQSASSKNRVSSRWWLVVIWMLAIPGIRPVVHEHREVPSNAVEAVRLEQHLSAFEHDSSGAQDEAHVHWVISFDGSLMGPFPDGTALHGPALNGWDSQSEYGIDLVVLDLGGGQGRFSESLLVDSLLSFKHCLSAFNDRPADACESQALYCVARL